ncbi:hypothetical protein HPG69_001069 [Diceros bicornis minor]|uniref:Uncharacterized protein n=1 Tax=Diceros bicornis minor TaxID=77932 RepID=A0A7J7E610_DICBM|nr:hypothetical protein HPG69_001069 [Diceros bicornis minor]
MASKPTMLKNETFVINIEDHSVDIPRKKISNFTYKNMKRRLEISKTKWACDMANKENKSACASHLPEQLALKVEQIWLTPAILPRQKAIIKVSQDRETMAQVLTRSIGELVAYLVRIGYLGVAFLRSARLDGKKNNGSHLAALLPLGIIKLIELSSKIEIINGGNIQILKQRLSGLWKQKNHLTLVPGYIGNIANDVDAYLLQLH